MVDFEGMDVMYLYMLLISIFMLFIIFVLLFFVFILFLIFLEHDVNTDVTVLKFVICLCRGIGCGVFQCEVPDVEAILGSPSVVEQRTQRKLILFQY